MRSDNDQVRTHRSLVHQDDFRGVALLNPVRESDVCLFGSPAKLRDERETLAGLPAKGLIQRDRVDHDEFGAVTFAEREGVFEGASCGLREVDRSEHARETFHECLQDWWPYACTTYPYWGQEGHHPVGVSTSRAQLMATQSISVIAVPGGIVLRPTAHFNVKRRPQPEILSGANARSASALALPRRTARFMEGSGSWRRVIVNTEIKARPYGLAPPGFRLPEAARLGSDLATNVRARGPALLRSMRPSSSRGS